jgi:hypothetical protein
MYKIEPKQIHALIAGLVLTIVLGLSRIALASTPMVVEQAQIQAAGTAAAIPFRHALTVNRADLLAMQLGDSFTLSIPGHRAQYEIVYDRIETQSPAPSTALTTVTWIGHLKGYADDYRTIVTTSPGHTVGRIATPEGNFLIESRDGATTLLDLSRAGAKLRPFGNDDLLPPHAAAAAGKQRSVHQDATIAPGSGNSLIDVLVLYNPSFVTATVNPQNAIANMIAVANQAMIDSGVSITFRLAATQELAMSDADDNDTILYKLTYPSDPGNPNLISDPVYTGVPALRDQYGADLVVAIRQSGPAQSSCGIAWTLTNVDNDPGMEDDAIYAYSVVSYGEYPIDANTISICDNVTMAHEMGHSLGSAHDYAHAQNAPVFTYSYGYGLQQSTGVPGFATIMAANYIVPAPIVAKYSSPNLMCNGYVCGADVVDPSSRTAADNVKSLNMTRTHASQFRPAVAATGTIFLPATGYWLNPAQSGRGFNIEMSGNQLFMAAFLYDQNGRATWYGIGPGAMNGNTYAGTLDSYAGGQTLTGPYQPPTGVKSSGSFSITFTSSTQATLTWPGGTIPIQRFDFGPGGSATVQPVGTPETGWWYAPTESGRGYAIEIQGGQLFLAGYMYDAQGNPVWYSSGPGPMNSNGLTMAYEGQNWVQLGNGQSLTGPYQVPTVVNANAGSLTIQFSTPTTGTLTFPDGRQVPIQRFPF